MIIHPIVAAAAVAAGAVVSLAPGDVGRRGPSPRAMFPTDWAEDIAGQARELGDFMARAAPPPTRDPPANPAVLGDAAEEGGRTPPPPLPATEDPWLLLGIGPDASLADARATFKRLAKLYHPDARVAPGAGAAERAAASADFARLNAALDFLKRREDRAASTYECTVYDNGERVTRSVVVADEDHARRDPTYVDYGRIAANAARRRGRPREPPWHERDDFGTSYDGYEPFYEPTSRAPRSRESWWGPGQAFRRDHGFGHIVSNERQMTGRGEDGGRAGRRGGGPFPRGRGRGRDDGPAFDAQRPAAGLRFREEGTQGYPYKHRVFAEGPEYYAEGPGHGAATHEPYLPHRGPRAAPRDPHERFPRRTKWWQTDDPVLEDFAP